MDPLRGGVYAEIAISAILIIALPFLLAPVFSSFYLSNLAPIPRPLSFCRCNLSPLITRSRKFVHISVSQPPTPLLSFCTPRYSPPSSCSSSFSSSPPFLLLLATSCRPSTQFQGTSRTDTVHSRKECVDILERFVRHLYLLLFKSERNDKKS